MLLNSNASLKALLLVYTLLLLGFEQIIVVSRIRYLAPPPSHEHEWD
jgi:hypothetical protein